MGKSRNDFHRNGDMINMDNNYDRRKDHMIRDHREKMSKRGRRRGKEHLEENF